MAEFVTLVNRTSKTLEGLWDGKHYELKPGKHAFPDTLAQKFKEQNPLMGSEDPGTGQMEYLMGIEEHNDDCSPIEQAAKIERWDRNKMTGPAVDVVKGKGGLFASERNASLPIEGAFVKP